MNEVLSAQQKTYAGWRAQILLAAWLLLATIAVFCNALVGYNARHLRRKAGLFLVLPMTISLSFLVISEIDVPGRGIIRVKPVNLHYVSEVTSDTLRRPVLRPRAADAAKAQATERRSAAVRAATGPRRPSAGIRSPARSGSGGLCRRSRRPS